MVAFRWGEQPGSGNMTDMPISLEKRYWANGSVDEQAVMAFFRNITAAQIPSAKGMLYRQDIRLDWRHAYHVNITVPYGPNPKTVGNMRWNFVTGGGTIHITSSLQTISSWGVNPPNLKQTIGWNGDDVDGCDIVVPALRMQVQYTHPQGIITLKQVKLLSARTAYVNHDKFMEHDPGEVLFLGASGNQGTDCETTITYDFAMVENSDGNNKLTIGDIANIVKQGHDYAWVRYQDAADAGKPTRVAKHVYVERVYKRMSFVPFFGFGA